MTNPDTPRCGARTVFWPEEEHSDAECSLPRGHQPENVHEDEGLGEWSEDEMSTWWPNGEEPDQ
jgi:hypothetical protein